MPLDYEEVDYAADSPTRARLLAVNPLAQVPTLVLPDGTVLTESLAMLHYLHDLVPGANLGTLKGEPGADLIPPPGDPARKHFYRWAVFLVAAVYPTFTYGDEPAKWVNRKDAAQSLRESTDRHREHLMRQLEGVAGAPWFLGAGFSALDLYVAVMTRWRPGRKWFAAKTPKLMAIAERTAATPKVAAVFERNFG